MLDAVDRHIAKRLRSRRRRLCLTLVQVGSLCGISFQQVHKYESMISHVSASMLWRLADALGVGIQYFYDGLDPDDLRHAGTTGNPRPNLDGGVLAARN